MTAAIEVRDVWKAFHKGDRSIFARGALKAAMWARDQKPGLYSMLDVLGLSSTI